MFYSMASIYIMMKAVYLFSLVRILVKFEVMQRYYLFLAIVYTAGIAFLSYVFLLSYQPDPNIRAWEIWLAKTLGLVTLYFWLLGKYDEGIVFWIILLMGLGLVYY